VSLTSDPYGAAHRRLRLSLLAALARTGPQPCPRCGGAMDARWPALLDLGHAVPVMHGGGSGPRRLEHATCNRSSGAAEGNRVRRNLARRATAQRLRRDALTGAGQLELSWITGEDP
jgi:hypothetical protein